MVVRRRIATLLIAMFAASVPAIYASAQDSSLEYAVKATYLYKFGPFVRWPENAFASPNSPFNICLVGRDPFGEQLDRVVHGEQFGAHPVTVRRLDAASPLAGCHVLYINGSEAAVADALKQVKGTPVLTVTDIDRDPGHAGIINFVIEGNRVRFQVDNRSASENDLVLSSKLLSLASSVIPKAPERSE